MRMPVSFRPIIMSPLRGYDAYACIVSAYNNVTPAGLGVRMPVFFYNNVTPGTATGVNKQQGLSQRVANGNGVW